MSLNLVRLYPTVTMGQISKRILIHLSIFSQEFEAQVGCLNQTLKIPCWFQSDGCALTWIATRRPKNDPGPKLTFAQKIHT